MSQNIMSDASHPPAIIEKGIIFNPDVGGSNH